MITRYGDFAHSTQITQMLLAAQTRSRETQAQISSGKVGDRFRDLGSAAGRLLDGKTMLQRTQQFHGDNQLVHRRLDVMESAVADLSDLGTRLRTLLLQRLSDGASVPGVLRSEAEAMLEEAVANLNATADGRHLFAGSRTEAPPVVLDPAFTDFGDPDDTYYQGDDVTLSVLADADLEISYGMRADREGFQELIGALRTAIEADPTDDEDLLEDALDLVNAAIPKLADYRAEIGGRQNQIERINAGHGDAEVYLEEQISDIENVDVAEAVSRLARDQMAVEASMATVARLSRLSLVNFLR